MDHLIAALGRTQRGLITRAQAFDVGLTRRMIGLRIESGRWLVVAPGVYRINGTPPSWEGRMLAECLSAGPDALTSHLASAALWSLEGFRPPGIVDLVVPRHLRHRRRPGVRMHESLDYDHAGATTRFGVPTTGAARTVLDLCAVLDDELDMLRALDDVIRRQLKIAIECNGKETHFTDEAFEYDPVRRNRLELEGWIVLDYTWTRLIAEPYAVLAEIRAAIELRASRSGVR